MSETIEVTVRVPADLQLVERDGQWRILQHSAGGRVVFNPDGAFWTDCMAQQIAAAVEARKPTPPKFQVGDVVEWHYDADDKAERRAGVVTSVERREGEWVYKVNRDLFLLGEFVLKLVRRAEK